MLERAENQPPVAASDEPLSPAPEELPLSVADEPSEPESVPPPDDELLLDEEEEPLSVPPSAGALQVLKGTMPMPGMVSEPHVAGAVHSALEAQN